MNARSTSVIGPCVAWLLSCAPFLIHESTLLGVSRTALAALPWIACAGLPRARRSSPGARLESGGFEPFWFEIALLLPPIALGAWLDLALGSGAFVVAATAISSVALCALLALGAQLSSRSEGRSRTHALAWLSLVVLPPLLEGALVLGGAPNFGAPPRWLSLVSSASPIDWVFARLGHDDSARVLPWVPLAVVLALVALGLRVDGSKSRAAAFVDSNSGEART